MDRFKYSVVSHSGMQYCNPLDAAKVEKLLDVLELGPEARALDIGAGKAELLLRLIERFGLSAVAVDRSPDWTQEAREQAAKRVPEGRLEVRQIEAADFEDAPESYDLAACMGATEIFGGVAGTVRKLASYVKLGGYVLVGDGYWKKPEPDAQYLVELGAERGHFNSHALNVFAGELMGLVPLYALVTSDDEWDDYEWRRIVAVEKYVRQHPDDPDSPVLLKRIRAWRDLYLRLGRDNLGFGIYLFQKQRKEAE